MAGFKYTAKSIGIVVIGGTGFLIEVINGDAVQRSNLRQDGHVRQGGVAFPSGYGLSTDTQCFRSLLLGHIFRNPEPLQILSKDGHSISFPSKY